MQRATFTITRYENSKPSTPHTTHLSTRPPRGEARTATPSKLRNEGEIIQVQWDKSSRIFMCQTHSGIISCRVVLWCCGQLAQWARRRVRRRRRRRGAWRRVPMLRGRVRSHPQCRPDPCWHWFPCNNTYIVTTRKTVAAESLISSYCFSFCVKTVCVLEKDRIFVLHFLTSSFRKIHKYIPYHICNVSIFVFLWANERLLFSQPSHRRNVNRESGLIGKHFLPLTICVGGLSISRTWPWAARWAARGTGQWSGASFPRPLDSWSRAGS